MAKIMHRQLAPLALAFVLAGALSDSTLAANTSDAQTEMLRSARMWEAKDRPDLARTMLEKALLTKEDATVLLLLICLELRSNNTKIAAKYLQQLEQHYPQNPNTAALRNLYRVYTADKQTLARVRLMARAGKADDAAKAMRQLFPEGAPPEELGLEYYQIVGNVAQGQQSAMTELVKRYKETGESRYRLAWLKLRGNQGDLQGNLRDYAALAAMSDVNRTKLREDWWLVLKRLPTAPASQPLVSRFLREFSDDQKAISFMADLQQSKEFSGNQKFDVKLANVKRTKDEPSSIIIDPAMQARQAGLAFLEQGQYDDAARELQKSLLTRPKDAEVLGGIGLLRMHQGNQDEALTWLQRAASIEPSGNKWGSLIRTSTFWQQMKLADGLLETGKLPAAQQAARQALANDPNNADALALLGTILAQSNEQAEAEQFYQLALKQNSNNMTAIRGLLALYSRTERRSEALTLIAEFRHKNPQDAGQFSETQVKVLREEADSYLSAHRPTHALQALETAVLLAPSDAWVRYDLASLYANLNLPAIGQRVMAEGTMLAPNDDEMNYAYAMVLASQGNEDDALLRLARITLSARTDGMNALETRVWIKQHMRRSKQFYSEGKLQAAINEMTLAENRAANQPNAIEQVAEGWFGLNQQARGLALMQQRLIDTKTASTGNQLYYASLLNRANQDDILGVFLPELYQRSDWNDKQLESLFDIETKVSLRKIERFQQQGDKKAAQLALNSLMPRLQETDIEARLSIARLELKLGNTAEARKLVTSLLTRYSNNAEVLMQAGYIERSDQQYAAALAYFQQVKALITDASSKVTDNVAP